MVSAENYQNLVGKTLIKSGQESSVQKSDNHVLESELPEPNRVEEPGSMYTFDFVEERLRVKVDEKGVIKSVLNG